MTKFFSGWGGLPPTFPVGKTLDSAHQPYLTFSVTFLLVASITFFHEGLTLVCFIFVFVAFVILLVFPESLLVLCLHFFPSGFGFDVLVVTVALSKNYILLWYCLYVVFMSRMNFRVNPCSMFGFELSFCEFELCCCHFHIVVVTVALSKNYAM